MSENKVSIGAMVKLGIILALYATINCVGLAFVYDGTKAIIDENKRNNLDHALKELFHDADDFRAITDIKIPYVPGNPAVIIEGDRDNPDNTGAFEVLKNGNTIGVALQTSRISYSGPIKILVGIGTDGKIHGVNILENVDTPGLGANAGSPKYFVDRAKGITFFGQFDNKSVKDPFVVKKDVIAITAATITSRAVAESIKAAGEAGSAWLTQKAGSAGKSSQGGSR